jgi:hypothetical protein
MGYLYGGAAKGNKLTVKANTIRQDSTTIKL